MTNKTLNKVDMSSLKINLSSCAKFCFAMLEENGFEAWAVGGFVRDAILGRESDDIDITTNATPEQLEGIFSSDAHILETGIKHGTVTVVRDGQACEITTFRTDGNYKDARHPENVAFVRTLEEDLQRRDFTINAICWNQRNGLYDPLDGISDLESGVIRVIGDPKKRFEEDALRMLRAARFVSQLGFKIERDTWRGIQKSKSKLIFISKERVTSELEKLLTGEHVLESLVDCADIIEVALPEITGCRGFDQQTKYHAYDVWTHIAHVVHFVKNTSLLRWTALFHDIGKPSDRKSVV